MKRTLALTIVLSMVTITLPLLVSVPGPASAYTPHDHIYIEGDAYFIPSNGVVGGHGTASDPYIIEGWDITVDTGCAIVIKFTGRYFVIRDVYLHDGWSCGIYLWVVRNARVESAIITNVSGGGLVVTNAVDSTFSNNDISGDRASGGMHLEWSSNVTIADNYVFSNHNGIRVSDSSNITIRDNDIDANWTAVPLYDNSNVKVFHNRIKGNEFHAIDRGSNQWDDGYPSGGNYWSNYTGSDMYRGPAQDQPGRDGIGDTPFIIDNDSQDRYPLIPPDVTLPTISIANPVQGQVFTTASVMVNGTAYDSGGSGLDFVMVRSNGGAWANATGTSAWNASRTLASGSNSIEARAWDKAGNPSAVASVTVIYSTNPVASFTVSPQEGTTSAVFSFDASACSDLEDPPVALTLRWDWEDDGIWDTSWTTDKTALHQFAAPGEYTVRLEVKDTTGLTNSTTRQFTVPTRTTDQNQWWPIAILVAVIVTIVAIVLAILKRRKRKKAILSKEST